MRVGVSGAGGFIGRHVVGALAREGHDVLALVHKNPAPAGVRAHSFDLTRPVGLDSIVSELDVFVHAAAHVPRVQDNPDEARACLEINALGTLEVLRACAHRGVRKVIVLSGANIYRSGTDPVAEDGPIDPTGRASFYLVSKACADFYATHFDREAIEVTILRPTSVYGPGLNRGMIDTFLTRLAAGQSIKVTDGGRYRADFVYVEDIARAVVAALSSSIRGPYNLGSGTLSTSLEVARCLVRLFELREELIEVEVPTRSTVVGYSPVDITRARRELGFQPRSLEQGLALCMASAERR
jgi:UDP-glucose 4-epimerase